MSTNDQILLLWMRDTDGNYYVLTEDQIRAGRATPEQQAALEEKVGDSDVIGYFGGFAPVGNINIPVNVAVVTPIQNQIALNIVGAAFTPVSQTAGNTGGQGVGIGQGGQAGGGTGRQI